MTSLVLLHIRVMVDINLHDRRLLLHDNHQPLDQNRPSDLAPHLLEIARRGLAAAGVDSAEIDAQLEVIARRTERRRTGALWQRSALARAEEGRTREAALARMLAEYLEHSQDGLPVHAWGGAFPGEGS